MADYGAAAFGAEAETYGQADVAEPTVWSTPCCCCAASHEPAPTSHMSLLQEPRYTNYVKMNCRVQHFSLSNEITNADIDQMHWTPLWMG